MYKVGQVVRVRSDLQAGEHYGKNLYFHEDMASIKQITIDKAYEQFGENRYRCGFWVYNDEMLAEVLSETTACLRVGDVVMLNADKYKELKGVRGVVVEVGDDDFLVDYGIAYEYAETDAFNLHRGGMILPNRTGMYVRLDDKSMKIIKRAN